MLVLWIAHAQAASVEEASKIVTGLTSWQERVDYLRKGVEDAEEAEKPRWVQAMRTVRLLSKYAPDTDRVVLRDLVDAAVGDDPVLAAEALKAARLGVPLPERVEGSAWMAHRPYSARTGSTLTLKVTGDEQAAKQVEAALTSLATAAKWTIGPGDTEVQVQVAAPRPSTWGPNRGSALRAQVTWPDGSTGKIDGFAAGPLRPESWAALSETLAGNVLAHASFDPRERDQVFEAAVLPDSPAAEVCLARLADNNNTGLEVTFDETFVLELAPASYRCVTVAANTMVRGHEGALPAPAGTTTWLQVANGSQFPWSRIDTVDAAKAQKWRDKGKVALSESVVAAR